MPFNELRKDYVLDRWAVIATDRGRRPTDFAKNRVQTAKTSTCPLCPGNENMTPPAVMLYLDENGKRVKSKDPTNGERTKNWLVRCIPNLYPAFSPPQEGGQETGSFKSESLCDAVGHHEVLVESPNHDEQPADGRLSQLELIINAYIDRLQELSGKPYVKYVSIFRNYGQEAGASLSHAHSQIIATPILPSIPKEEMAAAKKLYGSSDECAFCKIIKEETQSPRLINQNDDFAVFAPYVSISPMQFWIMPKKHSANILDLAPGEIAMFAQTLQSSLKALKTLLNDPPYNFGFHLAIDKRAEEYYHWHLEVYPKLSIWAGFELNTGVYINTVTPESAAAGLKKAMQP